MAVTATVSLLALVCLAAIYTLYRRASYAYLRRKNGCGEPRRYAHRDPVFGFDLFLRLGKCLKEDRYLPEQIKIFEENGPTFQAVSLGQKTIYTVEPENIRAIFTTDFVKWGVQPNRLPSFGPFCGRGFLTVDGERWHRSRKMFQPSFEKKAIANFSVLERFTQRMLSQIPVDGATFNIQPLLSSLYIDTITFFLFGESFCDLSDLDASADISRAFDEGMYGSGLRNTLGPLRFLAKSSKWLASCQQAQSFTEAYVDKALEYRRSAEKDKSLLRPTKNVLLYSLAEQTDDREHLRNEMLQAFFVSQATTANLVSNILFVASRNPEIWAKMRQEVREVMVDAQGPPTYEEIQRLTYTRKVINESLRLYPSLTQNARVALTDTTLPVGGGPKGDQPIFVQAGTKVHTSYYTLHRLPSIWGSDARIFNPDRDRWSQHDVDADSNNNTADSTSSSSPSTTAYEYLPFGTGPRRCIGQEKGVAEVIYVLVRLMQEFVRVESRDDREWKGRVALSSYNVNGCHIALFRG